MDQQAFTIERVLKASIEQVWKAITDKDAMKAWYFDLADFKAEKGFHFSFYGGTEEMQFLHLCEVTDVVPGKRLTYSWRYDGYPGISYVTFELFEEGSQTRLKLTHEGLERFPADNPDFARKNFEGGWNQIIGINLPGYLENL
jgi:uncharacterized protein YndB with AHSA1/START domain